MRVLVTSLTGSDWVCQALRDLPEPPHVAAFQARAVDLGDQGATRPDLAVPRSWPLWTAPVWPPRPYPASLFCGGLPAALRDFQPDVIYHIGEPSEFSTWQVIREARRHAPQAARTLFSFENVVRDFGRFPHALRQRALEATVPRLTMVAAASLSARDAWARLGFDPTRVRIVYVPIDLARFHPRAAVPCRERWGVSGRFVIGYVGRLVHEKAVDLLLRALAQLPGDAVLLVAGRGPLEASLPALAEDLGVAARVRWLGAVPPGDVPEVMCACDVLVLPSRSLPVWQEQFGRVLPEAMACGVPVIGSDSGAIPEVIGDAGLTFPEEDAVALAAQLARLAADPPLRATLAQAGRQRVQEHFTAPVLAARLMSLFREALALRV